VFLQNPIQILTRADHPRVKLFTAEHLLERLITPSEAAVRLKSAGYHAHGSRTRVKAILPFPGARHSRWERCYRNTEAPVIQPSIDWLQHRRGL